MKIRAVINALWHIKKLLCLTMLLSLSACSSPISRLYDQARQFGLEPVIRHAGSFQLQSFHHPATGGKQLHVYLEGDGRPWERGLVPASEPTTRNSVVLPLMQMDTAPTLYLGRPCYNGHAQDSGCNPLLWTDQRYSEQVVHSMAAALQMFCQQHAYQQLVLIGHSGGGALAMLLAARLPQTLAVVTLAGNYNIDVWTDLHGYQRLRGSLNPAMQPNSGIREWHILAVHDTNIPPSLFQAALSQRQNATVEIIDADHSHGWQQFWPLLLTRLNQLK